MKFTALEILGLYLIELEPFRDERGCFVRHFCENEFSKIDKDFKIVQINHSRTKNNGTIRGMHLQHPPYSETKVVRCIRGSIFDVAVDIRKDSPTFLKWHGEILSSDNMKMLYIPKGFAHGFQALEDDIEVLYLCDEFYNKEHENGIRYNDERINIEWKINNVFVSEKDKNHKLLDNTFIGIDIK